MADVLAVQPQVGRNCVGAPEETPVAYTYDANGNQTSRGADAFAYDHENRRTEAVIGGNTSTYAYNGDGLRASRTAGGSTANYTWDVAAGLPVILQDSLDNTYVYGLDLISRTDGSGNQEYHLYDGLGSTVDVMDDSGGWLAGYVYDAFGSVRFQGGSSGNQWLFTGEQRDSDTGLEYLRARYYDPAVGRFLSRDPMPGGALSPLSLNPYAYVLNNPLNWIDPWGLYNVEGTPTPTPSAKYLVCRAVHERNVDCQYVVPSGGSGIWGDVGDFMTFVVKANWEYSPPNVGYRLAKASSNWFNNTCPGQLTRVGIGTVAMGVGFAGAVTPGFQGLSPLLPAGYVIAFGGPPGQPPLEACQ